MFDPESFSLYQTLRISNRVLWEENKITWKSCVEEINKDKGEINEEEKIIRFWKMLHVHVSKLFIAL